MLCLPTYIWLTFIYVYGKCSWIWIYHTWILWGTDCVNGHALLWFTSIRGLFILQVSSLGSCAPKEKNAPSHNLGRIRNLETRSQVYYVYIAVAPFPVAVTTKGLGIPSPSRKKMSAVILVVTGILPGRGLHPPKVSGLPTSQAERFLWFSYPSSCARVKVVAFFWGMGDLTSHL